MCRWQKVSSYLEKYLSMFFSVRDKRVFLWKAMFMAKWQRARLCLCYPLFHFLQSLIDRITIKLLHEVIKALLCHSLFWGPWLCDIMCMRVLLFISCHSLTMFWHKQINPSSLLLVNSRWVLESYFIQALYKLSYRWGYLRASVSDMDLHNTDCSHDKHVDGIMKERLIEQLSHLLQILVLLNFWLNLLWIFVCDIGRWIVAVCFQQMVLLP